MDLCRDLKDLCRDFKVLTRSCKIFEDIKSRSLKILKKIHKRSLSRSLKILKDLNGSLQGPEGSFWELKDLNRALAGFFMVLVL